MRTRKPTRDQRIMALECELGEVRKRLAEARCALCQIQGFCWTAWIWGTRGNKIAKYAEEGLRRS